MAERRLGLLHTSATLVPMFEQLCKEKLPGVAPFNLVDDSLIKDVIAHGQLRPRTARRVAQHIAAAEDAGADYIMVTCSSIGAAVETAAGLASVPVLRVDQPMADHAIATARRIGVIATLPTTLQPTADLLRRRAVAGGKTIDLTTRLCEGAFDALNERRLRDARLNGWYRAAGVIVSGRRDCTGTGVDGPRGCWPSGKGSAYSNSGQSAAGD